MQIEPKLELSQEEIEKLEKDLGFLENPIKFDETLMKKALEDERVKEVRVFKMTNTERNRKKRERKARKKIKKGV